MSFLIPQSFGSHIRETVVRKPIIIYYNNDYDALSLPKVLFLKISIKEKSGFYQSFYRKSMNE